VDATTVRSEGVLAVVKAMRPSKVVGATRLKFTLSRRDQFWKREDDVSVRQIPPNRVSITGHHASHKTGRSHAFESTLERDFITLLEFDLTVLDYDEQPVRLDFIARDGRRHSHVPDVLVHFDQERVPGKRPRLYQVKYDAELREKWTQLKPALLAASRYAKAQGWKFEVVTDVAIRTPYLKNAKFLLPYVRYAPNPDDEKLLMGSLHELHEISAQGLLASIYDSIENQAQLVPTLWNLVGTRAICVELDKPLTMASTLWLSQD
jgi:hypothetical protein